MTVDIRLVSRDDAPRLSELHRANREYLLAGAPVRDDHWVSVQGQADVINAQLLDHFAGNCAPFVILGDGSVVGRITLSGIVRGAFHSASLGYWVAQDAAGRGVATEAVRLMIHHAFRDLNLHRVQAETTPVNHASARILTKAGFTEIGFAPQYLHIGGSWQDHRILQLINPDWRDEPPAGRS